MDKLLPSKPNYPPIYFAPMVLVPFAVAALHFSWTENSGFTWFNAKWKALYLFGLRIAAWRSDA